MENAITLDTSCKYRLPCGYCELKKEDCNWRVTVSVPCDDKKWLITPEWNPNSKGVVNCNGK